MTTFTDEIRETVSPYKFGGSRRAAACWLLSLDSCYDEASGDVDSPTGWFARHGRTIQYSDSQGFCDAVRYSTETEAKRVFSTLDEEYIAWLDANDPETFGALDA